MPPRAVLFDFDGLIVDTEMPEYLAWQALYARRGLTFPIASWLKNVGRNDRPFDPFGPFRGEGPASVDAVQAEWRALYDSIEPSFMVPLPGVVPLLRRLRGHGWRVAIGSSSRRARVASMVERLGLAGQFGAIAGGDEVPLAKPAPDVYLLAARRLEVSPDVCTVLEDSENGVRAAKAAGMRCIAVPSVLTRSLDFSAADAVLDGLERVTLEVLVASVPDGGRGLPGPSGGDRG
ncbi:MAG TPA: HAD-IA family hydrolase [bacterium]|nr:HAD-IA family hydrolase [bacterium]